jgi:glutathione S-transferase
MITFYYSPRSSATRIHWALEELGVPYEKVKLDLQAGDQRKPAYLALNPNGKVPLVVDDGVPVFESVAILIHLGQRYGQDKGLWPSIGAKAHGQALAWTIWAAATLGPVMFRYMMNTQDRFPAEARNPKQAESAKAELDGLIAMVEARVAERPYFLADTFTYVDLAISAGLGFLRGGGHRASQYDFSGQPHIAKWLDACLSRPAFKHVMSAP